MLRYLSENGVEAHNHLDIEPPDPPLVVFDILPVTPKIYALGLLQ